MLQNLMGHGPQIAMFFGLLSGTMTCVNGFVALFGKSDSSVGHFTAALGTDFQKLYKLFSGQS